MSDLAPRPDSPVRVAIVGNQPFTMARFRSLLIRDLTDRGLEVFALCPDWDEDPESRATVEAAGATPVEIEMDRASGGPLAQIRSIQSIRRVLGQIQPRATFAYFVKPVVYTALAGWRLGIDRQVGMIEGLGYSGNEQAAGLVPWVVSGLHRVATAANDAVFVMNEEDRAYFRDEIGIPEAKIHRLEGMGIDVEEHRLEPPPEGPFTFLFVARMLEQKGVWTFVDAAAEVRRTHSDARFVMLGGIDDSPNAVAQDELRARTEAAGVEWMGHVSNVDDYLAACSAFVLPSFYREGYPRSIMEAMAVGRAVITTDNPGCREAVLEGETGLVVPPRDVAALAAAMRALLDDPDRTRAMGRKGREVAEQRYDYRTINQRVIDQLLPAA